ncbi:MAG: hypothetical protein OEW75_12370 [Cyclobacteriaceae bacterium]|nr:hypothetical protein [Cyclobacteriaceae bacterium]
MTEINIRKVYEFAGHRQPIYALAYDSENKAIYSSGADGLVIRWQKNTEAPGEVVLRLTMASFSLNYDPNGALWIAENQFGLRKFNLESNRLDFSIDLGKYFYFDILSINEMIISCDNAGNLITGPKNSDEGWVRHKIGTSSIRSISISPDQTTLALGMSDRSIRICDLNYMKEIHKIEAHNHSVFSTQFLKTKPWLLSGGKDAQIKIWSTDNEFINAGKIPAHLYGINYLDISENDNYFLTCSMDKTIKLWDTFTGNLLKVVDYGRYEGHKASINKVKWIGKNEFISAGDDRKICLWEIEEK